MTGRLAAPAMALSLIFGISGLASAPARAKGRTPEAACATVAAKLPRHALVGEQVQGSYGVTNCNPNHSERLRVTWRMRSRCGFDEHGSDRYVVPVNQGVARQLDFTPTCAGRYILTVKVFHRGIQLDKAHRRMKVTTTTGSGE
jgi:hypothetical protein